VTPLEELTTLELKQAYATTATELRKRLTEGEAQYLSALIDGEGGIYITTSNAPKQQYFNPEVRIAVCHPMIIKLCNRYGGFWTYQTRKSRKTLKGNPLRPIFRWEWNRTMMKHYLPQILPYLKIKQKQVKLLLEALELGRLRKTGREEHLQKLRQLQKQIQDLNNESFKIDTTKYEHLRMKPSTRH